MSELRTEEEQLELIKQWWKKNGQSLIWGVGLAVVGTFGWKAWQDRQAAYAGTASALYQSLLQASIQAEQSGDEQQQASLVHYASQLRTDYADTAYAQFAALLMAKGYAEQQKWAEAQAELEWVLQQPAEAELKIVASLRLARIHLAQEALDAALAALPADAGIYAADAAELRGDILLKQSKTADARAAYQQALELYQQSGRQSALLSMKLDDLAVVEGA
ncbi:YfgM family protein [Balneatrix alpica]|uniref:Ancillary SecYEG translocon subunit n=1 Tax=Balneatrix alpica TaxID=75684 RepID=A0ABV5ZEM2_9GAMM|nr:tetratricopeptide repeat protein [Balneatrix alpica]